MKIFLKKKILFLILLICMVIIYSISFISNSVSAQSPATECATGFENLICGATVSVCCEPSNTFSSGQHLFESNSAVQYCTFIGNSATFQLDESLSCAYSNTGGAHVCTYSGALDDSQIEDSMFCDKVGGYQFNIQGKDAICKSDQCQEGSGVDKKCYDENSKNSMGQYCCPSVNNPSYCYNDWCTPFQGQQDTCEDFETGLCPADQCYNSIILQCVAAETVQTPLGRCCPDKEDGMSCIGGWCTTTLANNCSEIDNPPPDDIDTTDTTSKGSKPIALTCAEACEGEEDAGARKECEDCCKAGDDAFANIWTEVGCIRADQAGVIKSVMRVFFGVVTGIALLRFIQAGMMLNTDDPEKIKEGKSVAVSAVAALFFAALLPILMNFIGMDILGIGQLVDLR